MAKTVLHFITPRTELTRVLALMEAEDTPECELCIKKCSANMREIEVSTQADNADYFITALGGL